MPARQQHLTLRNSALTCIASRTGLLAGIAIASFALAGCGKVDRLATNATSVPDTYEQRHPIEIADAPHSVDIFPGNGQLRDGDKSRVRAFAQLYRERGRGPITVMFPQGGSGAGNREQIVHGIRRELAAANVGGHMRVGSYPVSNTSAASAVRLSFIGLKARVASTCGEWPDDLASASSLHSWQNKQYWNLGCSYQNMFATQVADPRDLTGPQGETPSDVKMRMRAIGKVRQGVDPGTAWKTQNSAIGSVGN